MKNKKIRKMRTKSYYKIYLMPGTGYQSELGLFHNKNDSLMILEARLQVKYHKRNP